MYYVSERIFCPALVPLQPQSHNTCARSQTSSVFDSKTPGRHHLFEDDCLVYAGGGRAAEDGWCQDYNGGNAEKIRTRVPWATAEKSDGNGDEHDCPDRNKDPARPSIQISGKPETPRLGAGRMGKIFSTTFSAPDPVQRGETAGMSPAAGKIKCCGGLRVMSEPPYRWLPSPLAARQPCRVHCMLSLISFTPCTHPGKSGISRTIHPRLRVLVLPLKPVCRRYSPLSSEHCLSLFFSQGLVSGWPSRRKWPP